MTGDDEIRSAFRREIDRVLNDSSRSYPERVEGLRHLRRVLHEELADAFAPAFNAALEALPHDDIADKRALCSAANETLKSLGLAIRDPKTGRPAILVADFRSAEEDKGRFRVEIREPGQPLTRTFSSSNLTWFDLCEAPVRHEPLARRHRPGSSDNRGR